MSMTRHYQPNTNANIWYIVKAYQQGRIPAEIYAEINAMVLDKLNSAKTRKTMTRRVTLFRIELDESVLKQQGFYLLVSIFYAPNAQRFETTINITNQSYSQSLHTSYAAEFMTALVSSIDSAQHFAQQAPQARWHNFDSIFKID
jgi:hypothetical protein